MTSSADELPVKWQKAKSSGSGECVEVGPFNGMIAVRDSKEPSGPALIYTTSEWRAFVSGVKSGEFDHLLPAQG